MLLAEADVPYVRLFEMDTINEDSTSSDVGLVVGPCEVVIPAAVNVPGTPISGMPILKSYDSQHIIVCKRTKGPGYLGVESPLFHDDNAIFLAGDVTSTLETLLEGINAPVGPADSSPRHSEESPMS